jgi:GNAT superfamily N-acetyltransferase
VILRPPRLPEEAELVAALAYPDAPDWPLTAAELLHADAHRPPQHRHLRLVAEDRGVLVGQGHLADPSVAAAPHRLRLRVSVAPQARGRGVGRALLAALHAQARDWGATELFTEAFDPDEHTLRFLRAAGYAPYHERIHARLVIAGAWTESRQRELERDADRLFALDLRVASLRQLRAAQPDADRSLYELDTALWRDIPFGVTGEPRSYEEFRAEELATPGFTPEAVFVALQGSNWAGVCWLDRRPGGAHIAMTGVVADWRRHGLARWLKLHAIRWAYEKGLAELRTTNDAPNTPIRALNAALGFVPTATELRLRAELAPAAQP